MADEFGFSSKESVRSQFKRERKKRGDAPVSTIEHSDELEERERTTYTESDDSIHVVCDSKRIKTRQDIIEFFNIDETVWKIKEFTVRTSEGYRKDRKVDWHVKYGKVSSGDVEDSGKILIVPMIHTETKFVRKETNEISFSEIDSFFENIKTKELPQIQSSSRQYKPGGLVLEIALADVHVGNESISFDELQKRVVGLVDEIKRKTKGLVLEKILLVQLGDIFHFDTYGRTTTAGTLITYGSNQTTMFDNGVNLMIWVIQELSSISKVELVNIYGNHDKSSAYMLGKTLEAYFRSDENVIIDTAPAMRKFRKIGVSSVAFVHGDMPKNNIYDIFQKEAREVFGETKYSEIHLGHLHHEISLEKSGVILRWLPSITIPDQWHKDNGYTGAKQGTQCFLWDKETGSCDIWTIVCK